MKLFVKRILYKILVISMIIINLSFFSASSVSEAKLKIAEGEFYYTGTQEGSYKPAGNFWEGLLKALGEIANYLLGIMTLSIRGVIVGWIEIMEIILTAVLGVKTDVVAFLSEAISGMDSYSQYIVNVEKIIFNKVPILNANMFEKDDDDPEIEKGATEDIKQMQQNSSEIVPIIKSSVAKWYYIMRLIVIAFMLLLLIFIGIKMAISTIASEKAVYKQMLLDWVAGMIIIFSVHYIMIFILSVNDSVIKALEPFSKAKTAIQEEYQYGDEAKQKTASEIETTLYETARTRAYSLKLTDGFTGMIIYAVLVYYAWKFALIYLKRVINIMILTLLAPAVSASYAFNKVLTGKAKIFSGWLSEYIMNVVIQIVHVVVYVAFVSTAIQLSLISIAGTVLSLVLLNFMTKADKLIRQIFKLSGGKGSLAGEMADHTGIKELKEEATGIKNAMLGGKLTQMGMKATYGAVGKAAGAVGMAALSNTVAAVENSQTFQRHKAKKNKDKEKKEEEAAKEYLESNPEAIEKLQQIEEKKAEKQKLLDKQNQWHPKLTQEQIDELKAEGIMPGTEEYAGALSRYGISISEQKKEKEETEKNIAKLDKEVDQIETALQKGFVTQQVMNGEPIWETFKGNLGVALRGLVEEKDGKYRSRKMATIREGGVRGAFWRKAKISKTLEFKQNMKLGKLFGLDSGEEKVLKSEMNFWKNRIIALGSMVAGSGILAEKPLIGMGLLTNSALTHLNVKTRKRRCRNRAAQLRKESSYTFKEFGPGAKAKLSKAETYHILEMDQLDILKHKKVRKEISSVMNWAKGQNVRESQIENRAKELTYQYTESVTDYEKTLRKEASQKSIADLAFEEKIKENNVVNVGDGICMQLQNNVAMSRFLDVVKDIDARNDISSAQKIHLIQEAMGRNKNMIITEAITSLCGQKGITDIANLQLTDADMSQINYHISDMIEKQGIVKKGEIDLGEVEINEQAISDVYLELNSNHERTNQVLEDNIVSAAILEYMASKSEKDIRNLNTDEAQQAIYDIVKDKLMPKSSKKSASVIEKLTGKDKLKEDFELPEDIKRNVEENIKKVKKVKKRRFSKRSRNAWKRKVSRKRSK